MCANFIDRDCGGESQSLESGFLVIDFAKFFVDEVVGENAQVNNLWAYRDFFNEFRKDILE